MKKTLVVATALTFLVLSVACKQQTVAIGGECSTRDDCKDRNDCMKSADGKGQCTKTCAPSFSDCPAPTTCQAVSVSIDVPGKTVDMPKAYYCLTK
jgi:hypothetical protein